ncbi:hypothetical protein [Paenibacillus sp. QZ-Y1]|uniref:hypothetical protein n=1 Tax=Paenibacillus sp. QZ-Y1 TaxID=3414511 RepID=UPI003F7B123B
MKYAIEYEHLIDELEQNEDKQWHFNEVKKLANKYRLELADDEFKGFLKLSLRDKDIGWLMNQMSYGTTFSEALISYIVY